MVGLMCWSPMRGVGQHGALVDADWDDLQTVLRTNIDGVLHSVRACVPAMRRNGGGRILIVSSVVDGCSHALHRRLRREQSIRVELGGVSAELELEGDKYYLGELMCWWAVQFP